MKVRLREEVGILFIWTGGRLTKVPIMHGVEPDLSISTMKMVQTIQTISHKLEFLSRSLRYMHYTLDINNFRRGTVFHETCKHMISSTCPASFPVYPTLGNS